MITHQPRKCVCDVCWPRRIARLERRLRRDVLRTAIAAVDARLPKPEGATP